MINSLRVLFFGAVAAVAYVSVLPSDSLVETRVWDKLEHLFAYGVLALLGRAAFRSPPAVKRVGLGLVGSGILLELAQTQVVGRSGDPIDALANAIGVVLGLSLMQNAYRPR